MALKIKNPLRLQDLYCHHLESRMARSSLPGLEVLECTKEAVSSCLSRLGENWLEIDDRRAINRFDRTHFYPLSGDF